LLRTRLRTQNTKRGLGSLKKMWRSSLGNKTYSNEFIIMQESR
jgi:hypothetical protein